MINTPFLLSPASKDYLWGGSRLNDDFEKKIPLEPLAETWECSTHPDGQSLVNGVPLGEVIKAHPELLGTHPLQITRGKPELPILVKFIDAKQDLSIQVHPDDAYALQFEHSLGKTEMWYVLDAKSGSKLIYGFNQDMTAEQVRNAIDTGTVVSFLNHVEVHKNDLFYIEAGTIHAIGAGCLIAEIQESSNITYRLYDYDRIDKNGKKRPLHIEKALKVTTMKTSSEPRQPMRVLKYEKGCARELLTRCKYFQVERLLLNTEVNRDLMDYQTQSNSFHVLLCIDGCGNVSSNNYFLNFFKGDCIFVPANSEQMKLHGIAQILDVSC